MASKQESERFILNDNQDSSQQQPSKSWTWGQIDRGDCTLNAGATFTLFADGATAWLCDIRSSDSGDEWNGRFRVTNAAGVVLFDTDNYHFDISESGVTKRWNEWRGPNGNFAAAFQEAQGNSFTCNC